MKIAIDARMAEPHPTGIGRVALNLIENLSKLNTGHEIIALTQSEGFDRLAALSSVTQVKAPFGHLSPRIHTDLPRIIKRSGAELAHYLYFAIPLYPSVPSVVTLFDTTYSHFPELLPRHRRLMYNICMKHCVRHARTIICSSQAAADDLCRFFPETPESRIRMIYLAAEDRFRPPDGTNAHDMKAALGLPEQYALYVGNHRGHKNLKRMIEAFDIAAKHVPHSLILPNAYGPGSEITIRAMAECRNAERIVLHPLPDQHLPLAYGLADAFVFPSLSEGFGLPPLEAMACGTPVITSNTSSLPEVVGDAGVLVDPHDVEELADAIVRVLSDPELRSEMSVKGLEQVKKFSWEETARQTLNVYEDVYRKARG